jgi:hypothetical protein
MQAPPEPLQLPLDECMQTTLRKQSSCISSALTGQTGQYHRSDRCATLTSQTGDLDRSDRCTPEPRNGSKPPENLLNASSKPFQAQTSPPCWQCMNQAKNAKFNIGCYTCPNEKVRYPIGSYWHQLQDHQVSQPLDEATMDLGNFAKNLPLMSEVLNMIKTCQNGKATQTSC